MKLGKLRCVIIAPNLEKISVEGMNQFSSWFLLNVDSIKVALRHDAPPQFHILCFRIKFFETDE